MLFAAFYYYQSFKGYSHVSTRVVMSAIMQLLNLILNQKLF